MTEHAMWFTFGAGFACVSMAVIFIIIALFSDGE